MEDARASTAVASGTGHEARSATTRARGGLAEGLLLLHVVGEKVAKLARFVERLDSVGGLLRNARRVR